MRMAASLLGLGLLAGTLAAQQPADSGWKPAAQVPAADANAAKKKTMSFHKEPAGPAPASTRLKPAAFQKEQITPTPTPPSPYLTTSPSDETRGLIQLEPPGFDRVFGRLESEANFNERIRQASRDRDLKDRAVFPVEPVISKEVVKMVHRTYPPSGVWVEPVYVAHGNLYFEQKNFERFGWDLGLLSPVVSAGKFYSDFVLLPYHMVSEIGRGADSSAGKCLPGDPVPFMLYPPGASLTGGMAEAAAIASLIAIFP